MSRRTLGRGLVVVGVILVLVSLLADVIGIGGTDTFGWKQVVGVVAGGVVAIVGYFLAMWNPKRDQTEAAE